MDFFRPRRIAVLGIWLALASGCGRSSADRSDTRDVATNLEDASSTRGHHLFYVDGGLFMRATCVADSVIFDRAHCRTDVRSVPASLMQSELYAQFGQDMELRQREAADHQVMIDRADRRLLDLASVDPEPSDPQLLVEIDAKLAEVTAVDRVIASLSDQIARLEDLLARGEDPDLREELRENQAKRADRLSERTRLSQELNSLRQRFIVANSSVIDPSVYQMIQEQRRQHVNGLASARAELDKEVTRRVGAAQALNMVSDQGFTYEFNLFTTSTPVKWAVARFRTAFERAQLRWAEFHAVPVAHQKSLDLVVTRSGELESFNCNLDWSPSNVCNQLRLTHDRTGFTTILSGHAFEVSATRTSHPALAPLLGSNPEGAWRIAAFCSHPNVVLSYNRCTVKLR